MHSMCLPARPAKLAMTCDLAPDIISYCSLLNVARPGRKRNTSRNWIFKDKFLPFIVAKMYHVLRTCLGSWPAVLQVDLKRSQVGPQYDICRDLSRTGPLFSTVFFQMGKVPYSHFRSPVRSDTAQSRVWEPCAHLAHTPVGILEAPRGTRRPPEAPCRKSSGIYPGVTWCPLAAIRGRAARGLRIPRGSSVVWGSGGATL